MLVFQMFAAVDSESHFSFFIILETISLALVEESLSVLKSQMFNVPLSLL